MALFDCAGKGKGRERGRGEEGKGGGGRESRRALVFFPFWSIPMRGGEEERRRVEKLVRISRGRSKRLRGPILHLFRSEGGEGKGKKGGGGKARGGGEVER